jgi:hypothetical protein
MTLGSAMMQALHHGCAVAEVVNRAIRGGVEAVSPLS